MLYYILFEDNTDQIKDIWNITSSIDVFCKNGSYLILSLILLFGAYNHHEYNMLNRDFDEKQREIHIKIVHDILLHDNKCFGLHGIRFSQLVWGAYFINARIIQIGRLQYELDVWKSEKYNLIKSISLNEGQYYIKLHIPAGEKLDEMSVKESLQNCARFIKKYFFEIRDYKNIVYFCRSWILSKELKLFLDSDTNIMKFQKMFDIIGSLEAKEEFLEFVFNANFKRVKDDRLPEETYLQKKVKKYLLNNGVLHEGIGIVKKSIF